MIELRLTELDRPNTRKRTSLGFGTRSGTHRTRRKGHANPQVSWHTSQDAGRFAITGHGQGDRSLDGNEGKAVRHWNKMGDNTFGINSRGTN